MLVCFMGTQMETNVKKRGATGRILGALFVFAIFTFLVLASMPHHGNRTAAYESAAASNLRTVYLANAAYAEGHPLQGYARKLSDLAQRSGKPEPGEEPAWMIDPVLAGGEKAG